MKKFRVILTDKDTGFDIYGNFIFEAPSFLDMVGALNLEGVSYRVVERLSPCVLPYLDNHFAVTPWASIPKQALLAIDMNGRGQ